MEFKKNNDKLNLTNYTVFKNVAYCIKNTAQCQFPLLCWCVIVILLNTAIPVLTTYLPKAVIEKFDAGSSLLELIATVLSFTIWIAVLSCANKFFTKYIYHQKFRMNTFYLKRAALKGLLTDYCNQENELFLQLQNESFHCCNGNFSPLTNIYDVLISFLTSLLGLIVFSGIITQLNIFIIVLLIITTITGYFLNKRIIKWTAKNNQERVECQQKIDYINCISGDIRAAKDIRLYNMQGWFSDIYAINMQKIAKWYKRFTAKVFGVAVCESGMALARESVAYIYLLKLVLNSQISVADFILYFGVIAGFSAWLGSIMAQAAFLEEINQKINYFRSYIEYPETYCRNGGISAPQDSAPKKIEFRNVSYKYKNSNQYALRNINLEIQPGEHLALTGLNGAGKTTFIKLVCGLTEPTEGQVLYDGIDIREYNRNSFYQLFSAVFQQHSIMPVTIKEITAETPADNINSAKVQKCLEQAGLWDKIAQLPKGADSEFGKIIYDDGVEFSGGEIQKLLLARALYKSAPVLVLDEPTAALDAIAESRLYENYHQISSGKTAFFISHRLASTRFCERILLIEDGVIREEGTHNELLALKGRYCTLFEMQAKYYREKGRQQNEKNVTP